MTCRLCGVQLDPQVEHSEVCSVAEATKGHYACVRSIVNGLRLADPTVTTEPQIFLLQLLSQGAALLSMSVLLLRMLRRLRVTRRKPRSVEK